MRADRNAIEAVRAAYPSLGWHGFGLKNIPAATPKERAATFHVFRREMTELGQMEEFRRACDFLATVRRSKNINRDLDSYGWKNVAERWCAKRHPGDDSYISNGMLIAAALALGFQVIPIDGGPNGWINIADSARHV